MQRVTDQVDLGYLEQAPPRTVSLGVMLNLLSDRIFERPLRSWLSPVLITGVVVLVILFVLRASPLLRLLPLALIVGWMASEARRIWRQTHDDITLLSNGLLDCTGPCVRGSGHSVPPVARSTARCWIAPYQWRRAAPTLAASGCRMPPRPPAWPARAVGGDLPAAHTRHVARDRGSEVGYPLRPYGADAGDPARGLAICRLQIVNCIETYAGAWIHN